MNNDLISRSALYRKIKTECNPYGKPTIDFESGKRVLDIINNAPTVFSCNACKNMGNEQECVDCHDYSNYVHYDERPQGEWIKITRKGTVPVEYVCSCCGRKIYDDYELSIPISEFYPFCHCGAQMQKGGAE